MSFDAFDHDDYRELIRNWIAARPARSQSMLARRVGTSRSKVGMVLAGARDIALAEAQQWAEGMDLDSESGDYFALLIRADSPLSLEMRRQARVKARSMREARFSTRPNQEQARWMARWYVSAIMELARLPGFEPDAEQLVERLWPEVELDELREGLEKLEEVGFLDQLRTDPTRPFTSDPELSKEISRFVAQYHHTQLEHASLALEEQSRQDRFFYSGCVGIREADIPALQEALVRFQVEILERFRAPTDADRIVQLSLNMFSRTKPRP